MNHQEQQDRMKNILDRCESIVRDPVPLTVENSKQCAEDLLWLMQLVEVKDTQIQILIAPENTVLLMKKFHELSPSRRALMLELMRELKGEVHEQ